MVGYLAWFARYQVHYCSLWPMIGHLSRSNLIIPQKAHQHHLRDVCVQYERHPPMGFRNMLRKNNAARYQVH